MTIDPQKVLQTLQDPKYTREQQDRVVQQALEDQDATIEGLGQQNTELEKSYYDVKSENTDLLDEATRVGRQVGTLRVENEDLTARLDWYRDQAAQYAGRLNRVEDLLTGFDDIPFGDVRAHIDFVLGVVTGVEK